jgi:hypothetical protein
MGLKYAQPSAPYGQPPTAQAYNYGNPNPAMPPQMGYQQPYGAPSPMNPMGYQPYQQQPPNQQQFFPYNPYAQQPQQPKR